MAEKIFNPPLTDRGVQNTRGQYFQGKNILIDWFQCTIKERIHPIVLLVEFLNINRAEILIEEKGLFSYNETYSYKDIKVMISNKNIELGTHIYITGKGCRDVEELGVKWNIFLNRLFTEFNVNVTRIDIAIDTFTDKYFTIQKIRDYIDNNLVVSRFKSSTEFMQKSLSDKNIESETIWFGSRVSNIQIVFYNKKLERINASYKVDSNIEHWYRVETRLRNEVANSFILNYLNEKVDIPILINEVLYNYLDFKDYGCTKTNRYRWNTSQWWLDFLETNKKLSLDINIKESDIVSKKEWLHNTVSKTEFMVYCSNLIKEKDLSIDMLSSDYIYEQLKKGYSAVTHKDIDKINDYRIKQGLLPLTNEDLSNIIQNVKSLLV